MRWLSALAVGIAIGGVIAVTVVQGVPEPGLSDAAPPAAAPAPPAAAPTPAPEPLPPQAPSGVTPPTRPDPFAHCRPLRPDWIEVQDGRLHLLSALPAQRTRALAALGSGVLQWLADTWGAAARPGPVRAVLVPDRAAFAQVAGALGLRMDAGWVLGVYSPHWDCIVAFEREGLEATLLHEGFHAYIAYRARGDVPTWFNEGFASYFGTAEWEGHAVRFRDQHHAAFAGMRGAMLAGRWIPLAELLQMPPEQFYDPATAPVAYLQSYCAVFTLEHLADAADRALFRQVRAGVLDGAPLSLPPAVVARIEAELLRVLWQSELPGVADLADRLRAFAPESPAADWEPLADAHAGPTGSAMESLPTGAAAARLAVVLRGRLRTAVGSRDPAIAALAARALIAGGAAAEVVDHGSSVAVRALDAVPPLDWQHLCDAIERRIPMAELRESRPSRSGPALEPRALAVELLWQVERAVSESGVGRRDTQAVQARVAGLAVPESVAFEAGATRVVGHTLTGADPRTWTERTRAWEAALQRGALGERTAATARTLARLARSGDARSRTDALAVATAFPASKWGALAGRTMLSELVTTDIRAAVLQILERDVGPQLAWAGVAPALARGRSDALAAAASELVGQDNPPLQAAILREAAWLADRIPVATVENAVPHSNAELAAAALAALAYYPGRTADTLCMRAIRERTGAPQVAAVGTVWLALTR